MFGRVSAVMSGMAIAVIIASIVVVIFEQMHSAPGRPESASPSQTQTAVPPSQASQAAPAGRASTATPTGHPQALSLECIAQRIRQAPAPFHWSFKRNTSASGTADWEADISSKSIVGTLVDSSGTYPIQADRNDTSAWKTAVSALTTPLPESVFALLQDLPAPVPAAVEKVGNDYTVKYVIGSPGRKPAVPSRKKSVVEPKDLIRGTVWVDKNGCPIKFVLDVEEQVGDGIVKQEHYEGRAAVQ